MDVIYSQPAQNLAHVCYYAAWPWLDQKDSLAALAKGWGQVGLPSSYAVELLHSLRMRVFLHH